MRFGHIRRVLTGILTIATAAVSTFADAQVGAVALDLPPAHGGLPIPVSVVPNGLRMGAAGRGWEVPLSFISESDSLAHRIPTSAAGVAPSVPLQVSMSLLGETLELIPSGSNWIPKIGSAALTAKKQLNATTHDYEWVVFDGNGLTYTFRKERPDFWLLRRIDGPAHAHADLEYEIAATAVSPEDHFPTFPVTTIDLKKVSYNYSDSGVAKNEVVLEYATAADHPLSLEIVSGYENGSWTLARVHTLNRIEVKSRATPGAPPISLSTYTFNYGIDPDTEQSQLTSVTLAGQQGTAQASQQLALASYEYGTATKPYQSGPDSGRELSYQGMGQIAFPADFGPKKFVRYVGPYNQTTQVLLNDMRDYTGDGRADMVWANWSSPQDLRIARNQPGAAGEPVLSNLTGTFNGGPMNKQWLEEFHGTVIPGSGIDVSETWRKVIDVDGDGRPDIIDATEEDNYRWVVYLNTPAVDYPHNTAWIRQVVDVGYLKDVLVGRGNPIPAHDGDHPGHLPLERSATLGPDDPTSGVAYTAEAWKLGDFNGDGRLDLLMEGKAPAQSHTLAGFAPGSLAVVFGTSNELLPNSAPVDVAGSCGVERTRTQGDGDGPIQDFHVRRKDSSVDCTLLDINGDGLTDSLNLDGDFIAQLGTGQDISLATIHVPGGIRSYADSCTGATRYTEALAGFVDLTGDGILDYVDDGTASIGTGVGFRGGVRGAPLLGEGETGCASVAEDIVYDYDPDDLDADSIPMLYVNNYLATTHALIDVDGDGRPEKVAYNRTTQSQERSKLVGRRGPYFDPGALSAGKVIAIENGHGGRTEIMYKSAKDDGSTYHQVPGPEIVMSAVKTTQASTQQTSETKYAYGSPIFGYDSFAQRFRSFGYGRTVALTRVSDGPRAGYVEGVASVTDTYPLEDQVASGDWKRLFDRYLRAGRAKDVTQLSGTMSDDPWSMLTLNLATAAQRGSTHYEYDSKVWPDVSQEPGCADLLYPYTGSPTGLNTCKSRGFQYTSASTTWSGTAAPPSTDNVMTESHVVNIDDFGRVTLAYQDHDTRRVDDDVCMATTFAVPPANDFPRVLTAVSESKVVEADAVKHECATTVLASSRVQYDNLPQGQVGKDGLQTSETVDRRDASGQVLNTIRQFDATYNAQGNVESVTTMADNGTRTRTVSYSNYDAFDLVPRSVTTTGTGVPSMTSTMELDPWTLATLSATDTNGLKVGTVYDGFGRPTHSTMTPAGGVEGVMATTEYLNFESTNPTVQRQIVSKSFDNPVPAAQVGVAVGHTTTTNLDDFGRAIKTTADLGSDYAEDMIVGDVRFDAFGRVSFLADPYPTSQSGATAYGTTNYFNTDGTPKCSIRGNGPQALPTNLFGSTNEAAERYPTCFELHYTDGKAVSTVWGADALLAGSPQEGVSSVSEMSAIGRQLTHSTWSPSSRLERSDFDFDRLGRVIGMTRYKSPGSASTAPQDPVKWAFAYDSLGQVLRQDEPNVNSGLVSRYSDYSDWSELVETRATATGGTALPDKRQSMTYDALGRLISSKQSVDGQTLPEGTYLYGYDTETVAHSSMPVNPMLGQLATVTSPTSTVHFAYDELGRMAARATVSPDGKKYIETIGYDGDGTVNEIGEYLPDTGNKKERVTYSYDSARRLKTAAYSDTAGVMRPLLATSLIDAFGRVRVAKIGDDALYEANYAETGRRLLQSMTLQSHSGEQREVTIDGYDPVGREKARKERVNLVTESTVHIYDALGRLVGSVRGNSQQILSQRAYSYDALGNLLTNADVLGTDSVAISYRADNRDRMCSVGYGATTPPATCNVVHDALGNVVEQPAPGGARSFSYLPSGDISQIAKADGSKADFRYDAFGAVQELDITGPGADNRHDRRYGSVEIHDVIDNGAPQSLLTRNFAVGGISASRKGPNDKWVFALGEARGNRFFVDEKGEFVQDVAYEPYGEARSTGAVWNSPQYTHEQWNGGDSLAKFGLHHLGARLYDPKVGRFLSADPITLMRTATTSNPYAFASNDPINAADPTGLDEEIDVPDLCSNCTGHEVISITGTAPAGGAVDADGREIEVSAYGGTSHMALPERSDYVPPMSYYGCNNGSATWCPDLGTVTYYPTSADKAYFGDGPYVPEDSIVEGAAKGNIPALLILDRMQHPERGQHPGLVAAGIMEDSVPYNGRISRSGRTYGRAGHDNESRPNSRRGARFGTTGIEAQAQALAARAKFGLKALTEVLDETAPGQAVAIRAVEIALETSGRQRGPIIPNYGPNGESLVLPVVLSGGRHNALITAEGRVTLVVVAQPEQFRLWHAAEGMRHPLDSGAGLFNKGPKFDTSDE